MAHGKYNARKLTGFLIPGEFTLALPGQVWENFPRD